MILDRRSGLRKNCPGSGSRGQKAPDPGYIITLRNVLPWKVHGRYGIVLAFLSEITKSSICMLYRFSTQNSCNFNLLTPIVANCFFFLGELSVDKGFYNSSVAAPDPGSGAFLTPGSGIRNRFFPDPGSRIPDPKPTCLRAKWQFFG